MPDLDTVYRAFGEVRGLLFDLDGTLADTMAVHCKAYRNVLARRGGILTEQDFYALVGPPAAVTIPQFIRAAGLPDPDAAAVKTVHAEKKAEFEHLIAHDPLEALPAAQLLQREAGHRSIAVVTSANRQGAETVLRSLGLFDLVEVLVAAEDVSHGKPDPEPYAKALDLLGLDKQQALAFEDHDMGIDSARAAGLSVIDVRTLKVVQAHDEP